jgi:hypothetical protein
MGIHEIDLQSLLDAVPDYQHFLTIDEMRASSAQLVAEYPDVVSLETLGTSRGGIPIEALKIGTGEKIGMMVGLPHPNEPIGAMMIEFFSRKLAEDATLREQLGYTWYMIKAIDPDGTRLNEGWFKGPFSVTNYARDFYRPPSEQQVEWTFPIEYKTYRFDTPLPETQAWMKLIEQHPPDFLFSLHNAGFGGVYLYISHDLQGMYPPFFELVEQSGLPLHLGEPEVPYATRFHDAVFGMLGLRDDYDFMEKMLDKDPATIYTSGASSYEYAQKFADPLFLICEMPYFYSAEINDLTLSETVRRESVLSGISAIHEIWDFIGQIVASVADELTVSSPFRDSIQLNLQMIPTYLESQQQHAQTSPEMEQFATRAELFDNAYGKRFYSFLSLGQLVRMLQIEIAASGARPALSSALEQAQAAFEREAAYLENNIQYDVIPIRKLVQVQMGSAILALRHR